MPLVAFPTSSSIYTLTSTPSPLGHSYSDLRPTPSQIQSSLPFISLCGIGSVALVYLRAAGTREGLGSLTLRFVLSLLPVTSLFITSQRRSPHTFPTLTGSHLRLCALLRQDSPCTTLSAELDKLLAAALPAERQGKTVARASCTCPQSSMAASAR
jgi:hypothetical protein